MKGRSIAPIRAAVVGKRPVGHQLMQPSRVLEQGNRVAERAGKPGNRG